MEIVCPACGKTSHMNSECSRCGCDLSSLRRLRESSREELETAAKKLKDRDSLAALEHAGKSWLINKDKHAARLAFLACISIRDFPEATKWYLRSTGQPALSLHSRSMES